MNKMLYTVIFSMLSGFGAATVVHIKKSPPFKICKIEKLLFMIGTNEKEFKISKRKEVKKACKTQ